MMVVLLEYVHYVLLSVGKLTLIGISVLDTLVYVCRPHPNLCIGTCWAGCTAAAIVLRSTFCARVEIRLSRAVTDVHVVRW